MQRSGPARVTVDGRVVGAIERGLVILVGITESDGPAQAQWAADKIAHLRVFSDAGGKMDLSLTDTGASALVVSQFTLYGDVRRGRRPSFVEAAEGEAARVVFDQVCTELKSLGIPVETGEFGAMMDVSLVNEGPVTILLDSDKRF